MPSKVTNSLFPVSVCSVPNVSAAVVGLYNNSADDEYDENESEGDSDCDNTDTDFVSDFVSVAVSKPEEYLNLGTFFDEMKPKPKVFDKVKMKIVYSCVDEWDNTTESDSDMWSDSDYDIDLSTTHSRSDSGAENDLGTPPPEVKPIHHLPHLRRSTGSMESWMPFSEKWSSLVTSLPFMKTSSDWVRQTMKELPMMF